MNPLDLKMLIEATLLAAQRPVTEAQLLELFDERDRPTAEQLKEALVLLAADYETRGIELIQVSSGWRIQIRTKCMDIVSRLWQERPSRYSRALLETLALIAYRQPITRSEIEDIRGVAVSSTIMRTLQERNWIRVVGHREVPGRPEVLGTTKDFLDYFGLKTLDQLPTLAELHDLENIGMQLELPNNELALVANGAAISNGEGGQMSLHDEKIESSTSSESSVDPSDATTTFAGIAIVDSEIEMNTADSNFDHAEISEDTQASDEAEADDEDDDASEGGESVEAKTLVADSNHLAEPLLAPPAE